MPPKRQSTDASDSAAKRAKPSDPPRNKRWSKVSASANADNGYNLQLRSPDAFDYICFCKPLHDLGFDDDGRDEEDDVDDGNAAKEKKVPCDLGKTCVCFKPAAEHPEHPWVVTTAATQKLGAINTMSSLRDPDAFGMYTYNDHWGCGLLEIGQNLILDFDEATTWKEKWAICEGAALFFAKGTADPLFQIDDGEGVDRFMNVVGTMFTTMLAMLDREGLMKPDSEVKSLGVVMGAFTRYVVDVVGPYFHIQAGDLDKKVLAYARKYNIELKGLSDIEDKLKDSQEEAEKLELPASDDKDGDPWDWKKVLAQYKKDYGPKVGGDALDISTWTPAERKQAAFDKKDPFTRKMISAIKDGMIMQRA